MAASDITNVRVESNTPDTAALRYSYGNTNSLTFWRSTDNITFTKYQTIPAAYGSYPSPLVDTTVASATLYYYKISDDNGSTFSSTVSVKVQTAFPPLDREAKALTLPTFSADGDVDAANLDHMRSQIEAYVNGDYGASVRKNCQVCPVNGALILDCADGCFSFTVENADIADINSISINCDKLEIILDVPPGTTTEICGWDTSAGFGGDECFQAPIAGPVDMNLSVIDAQPCPEQRTYYVASPCKGDYIYECYDKNSRIASSQRNLSVVDCSCATIGNGIESDSGSAYTWLVKSGIDTGLSTLDHSPMAGISIYYKTRNTGCAGVPGAAKIQQMWIGGFGASAFTWETSGKPLFGFAINVPTGVTLRSFTGHVLLFDHVNQVYTWGRYSGANLHDGAAPTSIGSIAMSAIIPTSVKLIIDATAGNVYSAYDVILENDTQTETLAHSSIALTSEPLGFGVFWLGNGATGNHSAKLSIKSEADILWW